MKLNLKSISSRFVRSIVVLTSLLFVAVAAGGINAFIVQMRHQLHSDDALLKHADKIELIRGARRLVSLQPSDALTHYQLGLLTAPSLEAVEQFETAVKIDPSCLTAHAALANAYENSGDYRKAIREYEFLYRMQRNPAMYSAAARNYTRLKHYAKAVMLYHQILSLDRNDLDCRYFLASTYYAAGNIKEARRQWKIVARHDHEQGSRSQQAREWLKYSE